MKNSGTSLIMVIIAMKNGNGIGNQMVIQKLLLIMLN